MKNVNKKKSESVQRTVQMTRLDFKKAVDMT
jgi:hypothetical protein